MVEGGQRNRRPDAQVARAVRDVHAHDMHRGADAVAGEVVLGEPDGVVAGPVHDVDALEGAVVDGRELHAPFGPAEELQHPDLHDQLTRRARPAQ